MRITIAKMAIKGHLPVSENSVFSADSISAAASWAISTTWMSSREVRAKNFFISHKYPPNLTKYQFQANLLLISAISC